MILKQIQLVNFRNYSNYQLRLKKTTVLIGKNGIGKSNILEAISMLSYAKSYRTKDENNLINYQQEYAQILGNLKKEQINFVISKNNGKIKKQAKIDGKDQKISQLFGQIRIVLFTPDSLEIVTGSPSQRRRFLDMIISQRKPDYIKTLIEYKKILKQKNELLKLIKGKRAKIKEIDFWNNRLMELSKEIISNRMELVRFLQKNIQAVYDDISNENPKKIKLEYKSKIDDLDLIDQIYSLYLEREIQYEKTLLGPHLDDLNILVNNKNATDVASRGEIRSLTLCLKICEINYLEKKDRQKNETLLLLDDIFSELDKYRRNKIIELIKDRQSVITTTDKKFIDKNLEKIYIVNLEENGQIK